jgi:hypothetical protein
VEEAAHRRERHLEVGLGVDVRADVLGDRVEPVGDVGARRVDQRLHERARVRLDELGEVEDAVEERHPQVVGAVVARDLGGREVALAGTAVAAPRLALAPLAAALARLQHHRRGILFARGRALLAAALDRRHLRRRVLLLPRLLPRRLAALGRGERRCGAGVVHGEGSAQ